MEREKKEPGVQMDRRKIHSPPPSLVHHRTRNDRGKKKSLARPQKPAVEELYYTKATRRNFFFFWEKTRQPYPTSPSPRGSGMIDHFDSWWITGMIAGMILTAAKTLTMPQITLGGLNRDAFGRGVIFKNT